MNAELPMKLGFPANWVVIPDAVSAACSRARVCPMSENRNMS